MYEAISVRYVLGPIGAVRVCIVRFRTSAPTANPDTSFNTRAISRNVYLNPKVGIRMKNVPTEMFRRPDAGQRKIDCAKRRFFARFRIEMFEYS
jgi:hypothetical protein